MNWFKLAVAVLFVFLCFMLARDIENSEAQSPQEVAPYKVAELPEGSIVYKMVHQGCELFIAERLHTQIGRSDSVAVSITTGRGCK